LPRRNYEKLASSGRKLVGLQKYRTVVWLSLGGVNPPSESLASAAEFAKVTLKILNI
jgi:hypothetical protein